MKNWREIFPTGPPPTVNTQFAMGYDTDRGRVVLYGGLDAVTGDPADFKTWELYDNAWHSVATANYPTFQDAGFVDFQPVTAWMVYDEARSVMVWHGSAGIAGVVTVQTWEYDGSDWTKYVGSTPTRRASSGCWDPVGQQIVAWGGFGLGPTPTPGTDDTTYYTYDGSWHTHTTAAAPMARDQMALIYDKRNAKVFMFGGYTGYLTGDSLRPDDHWMLDLSGTPNWTDVTPASDPHDGTASPNQIGENYYKASFHEANLNKVVYFDGTLSPTTWLWDGAAWASQTVTVSPNTTAHLVWDGVLNKTLAYGSGSDSDRSVFVFPTGSFIPQVTRVR